MKKFIKMFINYEREENWINDMASLKYLFVKKKGIYYFFKKAEKNKFIYRIELLENGVNHPESIEYIKYIKENFNSEIVCFNKDWIYFRNRTNNIPYELFKNYDWKIRHDIKILRMWKRIIWGTPIYFSILFFYCNTFLKLKFSTYFKVFLFIYFCILPLALLQLKYFNNRITKLRNFKNKD